MLALTPSVQSPAAYDRANLTRAGVRTRLEDEGYRFKIHPDEQALLLTDADLVFGHDPRDARRYGVVGDGVADDTTAAQRALSLGGDIYFPAGTYLVDPLVPVSGSHIRGAGRGKTIFKARTPPNWVFTVRDGSGNRTITRERITLADCTVDGDVTAGHSHTYAAIDINRTEWLSLHRVKVINSDDAGIRVCGYGDAFEDAAHLKPQLLTANPITTVSSGSAAVRVKIYGHSLQVGGMFSLAGVSGDVDGIPAAELNDEHAVTSVVDAATVEFSVTTTASAGSISGGGSAVIAQNDRYDTQWGQTRHVDIQQCEIENSYLGIELEGRPVHVTLAGCSAKGIVQHAYRLPSAEDVKLFRCHAEDAFTGYWIDRSYDITIENCTLADISGNGFGLGSVRGLKVRDCRGNINDTAARDFLVSAYQYDGELRDFLIEDCESNGDITVSHSVGRAIDGTIRCNQVGNIDVVRPNNSRIVVYDNGATLVQSGSLDANSTLYGGSVRVLRHRNGANVSRYEEDSPDLVQSISYAAAVTPDLAAGKHVEVGALTGNITINNPTNYRRGQLMSVTLVQDGAGGKTVTWGSEFRVATAIDATASRITVWWFRRNGANTRWLELSATAGLTA